MTTFSCELRALDPREKMEIELGLEGGGEIRLLSPKAVQWIQTDVEGLRHLLLMLEAMLEDYDKVTLGIDRVADAQDTEPL
jgi:hypothetical protein